MFKCSTNDAPQCSENLYQVYHSLWKVNITIPHTYVMHVVDVNYPIESSTNVCHALCYTYECIYIDASKVIDATESTGTIRKTRIISTMTTGSFETIVQVFLVGLQHNVFK